MLLPDMLERTAEFRHPIRDQLRRALARPVVGDDDLEIAIGLDRQRTQYGIECVLAVPGRDDHRNQISHASRPFSHAFMYR